MAFSVALSKTAQQDLNQFQKGDKALLLAWMKKNLVDTYNPRSLGYPLDKYSYNNWKYRIGDYRILCLLEKNRVIVLSIRDKSN